LRIDHEYLMHHPNDTSVADECWGCDVMLVCSSLGSWMYLLQSGHKGFIP